MLVVALANVAFNICIFLQNSVFPDAHITYIYVYLNTNLHFYLLSEYTLYCNLFSFSLILISMLGRMPPSAPNEHAGFPHKASASVEWKI